MSRSMRSIMPGLLSVQLLIAESLLPVILNDDGCRVESGLWFDPYTGLMTALPAQTFACL